MCGIAGWLTAIGAPDQGTLRLMTDALSHRGPDASGLFIDGNIGLGHRRLSIIDTSETANQPMEDIDGLCTLVFNGEIYNFRDLRAELEALGHRFRTRSDTEVILESYKRYGVACVDRFNGMFAFALWDKRERCLFLARDRAGEKPLFYVETSDGFLFASEPRALRRHPLVDRTLDQAALAKYLTLNYVPGPGTLNVAIRKLPPGCVMTIEPGGPPLIKRYWTLASYYDREPAWRSEREAADALGALIDDATRLRMISDVPLGAFLSSGVDSATVVAAMTQSAGDVRTFSIGFDAAGYDESPGARETAAFLDVTHADRYLDFDTASMISALTHAASEPLADNSVVPMWFLSRFAREHVTVALSGDGGDEMFGGYETYVADQIAKPLAALPAALWRGAAAAADRLLPVSFDKVSWDYKARHFLKGLAQGWPRAHFSWRTIFHDDERRRLMRADWREASLVVDPFEDFALAYDETAGAPFLNRAMYVDAVTWMADDVLVKVDRMSMAHGLEVRAPFLDHRIMEFAASLPPSWKVKLNSTKRVLKDSQRARLPTAVLSREKLGFNAPMSRWLLGPLKEFARDELASSALDTWLVRSEIDRLWREHEALKRDNSFKLFGLICLSTWLRMD